MSVYYKGKLISGIREIPQMTLSEYNALSVKPDMWVRTDSPDSDRGIDADDIEYDENNSVKDKIDSKVSKSGDTMNGNLSIDSGKTGETSQMSRIILGNNKASGVDGKSMGSILMYGSNSNYVNIVTDNITSDRMIKFPNNNGTVALTSDLGVCDTLLEAQNIPTTEQLYNCNWQNYYFLSIEATFYNNVMEQTIIPTSYFNITSAGARPELYDNSFSCMYQVYKYTDGKIYILASKSDTNRGIRIYGIMKKPV